jgi:CHAT domain-containing protein
MTNESPVQAGPDAHAIACLHEAIMAGIPNGRSLLTLRRIEAQIDKLAAAMEEAIRLDEPAPLDAMLNMLLLSQRKFLGIPEDATAGARLQQLSLGWQRNTLTPDEKRMFERSVTAWNIRQKLQVVHPELVIAHPPPDPEAQKLLDTMRELGGPLQEAMKHTVPGDITPDWLNRVSEALERHRQLLATVSAGNAVRPSLCYTMGSAAYALGRGLDQSSRPAEAASAYTEAAKLYLEAGEKDDAENAAAQARWLTFALTTDIDGGSFEDLQRLAGGIEDPLDRALVLSRLGRNAVEANDQAGAARYAQATQDALVLAGFPAPAPETMSETTGRWIDEAVKRRSGLKLPRLLQQIGQLTLDCLATRHSQAVGADPAEAARLEQTMALLHQALLKIVGEANVVAAEIRDGLRPYMPQLHSEELPPDPNWERAMALWPRINALLQATQAEAMPDESVVAAAGEVAAEAIAIGQPGLVANACLVRARLLQRTGDLSGSAAAAAAGEAGLLPHGATPDTLTNPDFFAAFLMLREHRGFLEGAAKNYSGVLDLAEGAIKAIEAARYRINDPLQQGAYLAERTRFYEMAAFSAFKLEKWDNLVAVMDLVRARSALRNRLAPPPDDDVAGLAARVAETTRAIEAAPAAAKPALRDSRQILWSLLSIARMRGAAAAQLPELNVAAIQAAIAPDEAVISWMWVATGILLVLAIDKTRIHAERIILSEQCCATLENYVNQILAGKLLRNQLAPMVNKLAGELLPPDTRAFIAGAARLILSPHRRLHLIPFHAAQFDGKYLIEQAAIRYVPNLGSLLIPWNGTHDGEIFSVGINDFGNRVPSLRGAEAEAEAVAAAWSAHGHTTTVLTGAKATRAAFLALPLDRCRILHLATHGLSVYDRQLKGDPFASLLCLQDGDLEALTLAELPLRAELVILSACNSGQRALSLPGLAELPGDDLFGLQAGFFQAGARSVIGTLWTLDDSSAGAILPELHRHLALGAPAEEALRQAACAYLRTPDAAKGIYYWAPLFMNSIGRINESNREPVPCQS